MTATRSKRQQWHAQIGQVMEEQFPHIGNAQPELLAHHVTQAGLFEHAATYWQRAGELADHPAAHALVGRAALDDQEVEDVQLATPSTGSKEN